MACKQDLTAQVASNPSQMDEDPSDDSGPEEQHGSHRSVRQLTALLASIQIPKTPPEDSMFWQRTADLHFRGDRWWSSAEKWAVLRPILHARGIELGRHSALCFLGNTVGWYGYKTNGKHRQTRSPSFHKSYMEARGRKKAKKSSKKAVKLAGKR